MLLPIMTARMTELLKTIYFNIKIDVNLCRVTSPRGWTSAVTNSLWWGPPSLWVAAAAATTTTTATATTITTVIAAVASTVTTGCRTSCSTVSTTKVGLFVGCETCLSMLYLPFFVTRQVSEMCFMSQLLCRRSNKIRDNEHCGSISFCLLV